MAPRKKRRLPKLPLMRNTNEVFREEFFCLDLMLVASLALVVINGLEYILG
jgi:hypothetical protein